MRDPFPGTKWAAANAMAEEMHVEPDLLLNTRGTPRNIMYLFPGQPKPSYFFYKLFGWKDNQRYEDVSHLQSLMNSRAYLKHHFSYTGQEGWFFSPYEEDSAQFFLKKMGQFIEGTLFDWQIADVFGGCTAGDIRVRFKVVDPEKISVVGKYIPSPTQRVGIIDNLKNTDFQLGLVHAGAHSYEVLSVFFVFF